MYVIKLPGGRLRVPSSALSEGGHVIGQAYAEIGPDHPDYERLLAKAVTEEEMADRRDAWRAGDDDLRRRFEEFKAEQRGDG